MNEFPILKCDAINPKSTIVVAVSGGIDSMVLAFLLLQDHKIILAHVNHKKRGEESDKDEALVRQFANDRNCDFRSIDLPSDFAASNNFQENARIFRYQWLKSIAKEFNTNFIATAHHADDVIETFFINLLRQSGLDGLSGIQDRIDDEFSIIRPLTKYYKKDLLAIAQSHSIPFRDDASNFENHYLRNKIRNLVIPNIEALSENGLVGILGSIEHLKTANDHYVSLIRNQLAVTVRGVNQIIPLDNLLSKNFGSLTLFSFAKSFGFNLSQCKDLLENKTDGMSTIFSEDYEMIRERNELIIRKKNEKVDFEIVVLCDGEYEVNNQIFRIYSSNANEALSLIPNRWILKSSESMYPFIIRSRKDGDKFSPLGMNGQQKTLKKFIIDSKLSVIEKESLCIFEKNKEIFFVSPLRLSEIKVKDLSQSLVIELI